MEIVLFIAQTTTCSFCHILIAKTVQQLWEEQHPKQELVNYILIVTGPLLCLCLIRGLKYLALLSFIADFCISKQSI